MNVKIFGTKVFKGRNLAFVIMLAMLLVACSSSTPASQPHVVISQLSSQLPADGHPPVILRSEEREEIIDGFMFIYQDIFFTDPEGDAFAVTYHQISSSLTYPIKFTDDPIEASAEEQLDEALFTVTGRCWQKLELVFVSQILDRAGNVSEPVTFRMSCTTPPAVDTRTLLVNGLSMAIPIALLLVLGFVLLFRKNPSEKIPALRSMLLFFCLVLLFRFIQLILHEGGHALYLVVRHVPFTLYVHPFNIAGYNRPIIDSTVWKDILGSAVALPLSMLISLPFWKRRSLAVLPLVMLLPYVAINDGVNIMGFGGDFWNLVHTNNLSPIPFFVVGALIIVFGIVSLFSLLPLIGLDPKDKKTLFILPAAFFLWSALSFVVAILFVPGSPIDREYFLGQEILAGANTFLFGAFLGLVLTVLYMTLYRKIQPRLPAWLRTEKVELTWKDLRIPGLLAAISTIIGLIVII